MSATSPLSYGHPQSRTRPAASNGFLPNLPVELQIQILSQIPLLQLFTLRCSCVAWNAMLSNPHLLEHFHYQIPYLSSSTTLESRLKRRQRLRHNKPVWARQLEEVFPWAELPRQHPYPSDLERWERYWKGWLAVLISSPRCWTTGFDSKPEGCEPLVLKIGHIKTPKKITEIDIGELLSARISEVHKREGDVEVEKVKSMSMFLHIQDNVVLVGVKVSVRPKGESGERSEEISRGNDHSVQASGKLLEMFYIFAFDTSGTLICHIDLPYSDPHETKIFRFNSTHLLVLSIFHAPTSFALNFYLLSSGKKIAPEITIRRLRFRHYPRAYDINYVFGFDDAGNVWFPHFEGEELEFSCPEEGVVWESNNLPISPCGGWVVFSGIHGLSRALARRSPPGPEEVHKYYNTQSTMPSETPKLSLTKGLRFSDYEFLVNYSNITLTSSPGSVRARKGSYFWGEASYFNLEFRRWKSKSQLGYPLTHQIRIPSYSDGSCSLQHEFRKPNYGDRIVATGTVSSWNIPSIWGYTPRKQYICIDNLGDWMTKTMNLLPYENGGYVQTKQENGLPDIVVDPSKWSCIKDQSGQFFYLLIDWRWGDDGLVVWDISKTVTFEGKHSEFKEQWAVCYDEEWDLPAA